MRIELVKSRCIRWKGAIAFLTVAILLTGLWGVKASTNIDIITGSNELAISGSITSLPDTEGWIGDWTVARIKVKVTDKTRIDQSNGKVTLGALVVIEGARQNDGSVLADRIIVKLSPPDGAKIEFTGKIDDLPSTPGRIGEWKISGRSVLVTSATKINEEHGQVAIDAIVNVVGIIYPNGKITALEIEVRPDANPGTEVRFVGRVERLPDTPGHLGTWVVSGRKVIVVERTEINREEGPLMIGSVVEVRGLLQDDRSVLARHITVKAVNDPPSIRIEFRGVIESLPQTEGFIGDWKISGRHVIVSDQTKIDEEDGKVAVGAIVEVSGTVGPDRVVKAYKIKVRRSLPEDRYIKFIGVVRSLPPATAASVADVNLIGEWNVSGRTVHVSADTKIDQEKGKVVVGALVEVEGKLRDDRSVDARYIEVKTVLGETLNYVRYFGTVESLPENNTRIGEWKIAGRIVHVWPRTRIRQEHGPLRIGAYVEVEGNQRDDSSIDAFRIEVERNAGAPEGTIGFINFYGLIKSLPDTRDFVGTWEVSNRKVIVTENTRIDTSCGQVVIGAFVEVYAYLPADGPVQAIRIEVRPVPTEDASRYRRSFIEFIAGVESLPETRNYIGEWVVGGRTVHVRRRTVINRERAMVTVGATVEVVGAELPNGEVDAKLIEVEHGPVGAGFVAYAPLTSVNAGNYGDQTSPSSIIASFGENLAPGTLIANTLPLPTQLGGVSVLVDGLPAGLFFVSPNQINYQVPEDLLPGRAQVTVVNDGDVVAQGVLVLENAGPSLFTADASGGGAPSGLLLRIKPDGQQSYEPLAKYDAGLGKFVPLAISRGVGDRLFLILYGTGLSGLEDSDGNPTNGVAESVSAMISDQKATVLFAGPAPGFAGMDQLNLELPPGAAGANLIITIKVDDGDGHVSNANSVKISIQ